MLIAWVVDCCRVCRLSPVGGPCPATLSVVPTPADGPPRLFTTHHNWKKISWLLTNHRFSTCLRVVTQRSDLQCVWAGRMRTLLKEWRHDPAWLTGRGLDYKQSLFFKHTLQLEMWPLARINTEPNTSASKQKSVPQVLRKVVVAM